MAFNTAVPMGKRENEIRNEQKKYIVSINITVIAKHLNNIHSELSYDVTIINIKTTLFRIILFIVVVVVVLFSFSWRSYSISLSLVFAVVGVCFWGRITHAVQIVAVSVLTRKHHIYIHSYMWM